MQVFIILQGRSLKYGKQEARGDRLQVKTRIRNHLPDLFQQSHYSLQPPDTKGISPTQANLSRSGAEQSLQQVLDRVKEVLYSFFRKFKSRFFLRRRWNH